MKAWLNGDLVDTETAMVAASDRGFTLGDGLFETLCVEGAVPRFFDRHWARLSEGAALLEIPLSRSAAEIRASIGLLTEAYENCALRLTVSRGPAARGVRPPASPAPTWLMTCGPIPPMLPLDLVIATTTRRNEGSPLARIKSLCYLDNILAMQEAARRGADDALLLNNAGRLTEATAANCFFEIADRLVTPRVDDGALPGIMRGLLITHCGAVEASLRPRDLDRAAAGFLSNSLGIRTIRSIDGRLLEPSESLAESCRRIVQTLV